MTRDLSENNDGVFWRSFDDPQLTSLVERALIWNKDLRAALARYDSAQALLGKSKLDVFPIVTANAEVEHERISVDQAYGFPRSADIYSANAVASWELDFFGALRRAIEARDADASGRLTDLCVLQISIVAEVANAYVDLRGAQLHLKLLSDSVDNQTETFLFAARAGAFVVACEEVEPRRNQLLRYLRVTRNLAAIRGFRSHQQRCNARVGRCRECSHRQSGLFRQSEYRTQARAFHGVRPVAAGLSGRRDRWRILLGWRARIEYAAHRDHPRESAQDTLVFQVDLWSAKGTLPSDFLDVAERTKDIQYSSHTRAITDFVSQSQKHARLIKELLELVPEKVRRTHPLLNEALEAADGGAVNVVHLIYKNKFFEGHYKDFELSNDTMSEHWENGLEDIRRSFAHPEWFEIPSHDLGFVTHDLHRYETAPQAQAAMPKAASSPLAVDVL